MYGQEFQLKHLGTGLYLAGSLKSSNSNISAHGLLLDSVKYYLSVNSKRVIIRYFPKYLKFFLATSTETLETQFNMKINFKFLI